MTGWIAGGITAVGLTLTGRGSGLLGFATCFALSGAAAASAWYILKNEP